MNEPMSRLAKIAVAGLTAVTIAGCTTSQPVPCATIECAFEQGVQRPLYARCMNDLRHYAFRSPMARKAIDREYRYPFVSSEGYMSLFLMGAKPSPSPQKWCGHYAALKAQAPLLSIARH